MLLCWAKPMASAGARGTLWKSQRQLAPPGLGEGGARAEAHAGRELELWLKSSTGDGAVLQRRLQCNGRGRKQSLG